MLNNFGGRTGMYGELHVIASQPAVAYSQASNLVGMGLTPEAIETYLFSISFSFPLFPSLFFSLFFSFSSSFMMKELHNI